MRASRRSLSICPFGLLLAALACQGPAPPPPLADLDEDYRTRIQKAREGLDEDPIVDARMAEVEAARRREDAPQLLEEVELRVRDEYIDEHQVKVTARVPIKRPSELRAQRDVLAAETRMAVSRLEEASLERRAELCFPSIATRAADARRMLYAAYADRQRELLAWNAEWRGSGTIDELTGARFELESRTKLAAWEPEPVVAPEAILFELPALGAGAGKLLREPALLQATVRRYHPSVALRRATAARYRALAERARARNQPWLKFVDVSYEHRSDDDDHGGGGQLAFEIPLGGERANVGRYESLIRQQTGEAEGFVQEQMTRSLQALEELDAFERKSERFSELLRLADEAEAIADRWWKGRLTRPDRVAGLVDEAFRARSTVIEARERAGSAYCTLLAMTGVRAEAWPRSDP